MKNPVIYLKNTAKLTALISFIMGTLILVTYVLFHSSKYNTDIIQIGISYVSIAIVINTIIFIITCSSALYYWNNRLELFASSGLLLLNIPIAFAYFFIVLSMN